MSDDFNKKIAEVQDWINKNIAHFNAEHPDPKAENYNTEFTKLIINHIAYAIAIGNVNGAFITEMAKNLAKPTDLSQVQNGTDPERSRQREQSSRPNQPPIEVVSQADALLPKRILRKKAGA